MSGHPDTGGTHEEGARYVVITGARGLVAARRAGMTEVLVVVRNADSATLRILQLLENLQRQEPSPADEARAYQELMDLQGLTPPKIALRVRRHEQHVRDRLRLLRDQVLAVERRQICARWPARSISCRTRSPIPTPALLRAPQRHPAWARDRGPRAGFRCTHQSHRIRSAHARDT